MDNIKSFKSSIMAQRINQVDGHVIRGGITFDATCWSRSLERLNK